MKTLKKWASLALTLALLLSLLAPAALATQTSDTAKYEELTPDTTLRIKETLQLEKDSTNTPTVTYKFSVVDGFYKVAGEGLGGATGNPSFDNDTVTFDPSDTFLPMGTDDYSRQCTKEVVLDFSSVTFTEPGTYRWTIIKTIDAGQSDTTNGSPTNNKQITYVYVTVLDATDANGMKLDDVGYIYTKTAEIPDNKNFTLDGDWAYPVVGMTKIDSIEDQYPARYRDLTFGKKVKGNQGSKDKYFKFTLTLTGLEPGSKYDVSGQDRTDIKETDATTYNVTVIKAANDVGSLTADGEGKITHTFYLQHGDYVTVQGLPVGATYNIAEDAEGYKKTAGTDDVVTATLTNYDKTAMEQRIADLQELIDAKEQQIADVEEEIGTDDPLTGLKKAINDIASQMANETTLRDAVDTATEDLNNAKQALDDAQSALDDPDTGLNKQITDQKQVVDDGRTAIQEIIANATEYADYARALQNYENALDALLQAQVDFLNGNIDQADLTDAENAVGDKWSDLQDAYEALYETLPHDVQEDLEDLKDKILTLKGLSVAKLNALAVLAEAQNDVTDKEDALNTAQENLNNWKKQDQEKARLEARKTQLENWLNILNEELNALQTEKDKVYADLTNLWGDNNADPVIDQDNTRTFNDPVSGTIEAEGSVFTGWTNEKETIVPTGILLQVGAPIAGIVTALALFLVILAGKKKKHNAA